MEGVQLLCFHFFLINFCFDLFIILFINVSWSGLLLFLGKVGISLGRIGVVILTSVGSRWWFPFS